MTSSSDIFFSKLSRFAGFLRKQGMQIGLAEIMDAARALQMTGFEDRETVKAALRMLFAKSVREQRAFDACFDEFFVSEEEFQKNEAQRQEAERAYEDQRRRADEELQYNGKPIDLRDDLKDVYARMPQEERDRLKRSLDKYSENLKRSPDLYEGFIRSVFMKSLLEQQMIMEDAAEGSRGADSDADLLMRDISNFREEEIPRAYQLIDQATRQINGEVAARQRACGRSAALDFKKTIRAGLSTGGAFNRLYYKRRRQRKKRIVMLCDVSGSMLQFAEFAIRFIKSMSDISDHSELFLFSETAHRVNPFMLESVESFGHYVRHSGVWGKGTNIGRALETVCAARPSVLGPSSVLLILSDAKTVDLARAETALERAGKAAGSVVWLNPIPENKWPYLRGVTVLKQRCQMVPCSTLNDLACACARLV